MYQCISGWISVFNILSCLCTALYGIRRSLSDRSPTPWTLCSEGKPGFQNTSNLKQIYEKMNYDMDSIRVTIDLYYLLVALSLIKVSNIRLADQPR